jgi:hypothetical protein
MEVDFSQPLGLWSFCSLGRSRGGCPSPSFYRAMEFCVGFSSSHFFDRRFILRRTVGRCCYCSCRRWSVLAELYLFLYFFDVRSTLFHRLLRDTRHSDGSTGVFWSCLFEQRVTVTLHLFSPCKGGAWRQGGRSAVW